MGNRQTQGYQGAGGKLEWFWKNVSSLPALSKDWCLPFMGKVPRWVVGWCPLWCKDSVDEVAMAAATSHHQRWCKLTGLSLWRRSQHGGIRAPVKGGQPFRVRWPSAKSVCRAHWYPSRESALGCLSPQHQWHQPKIPSSLPSPSSKLRQHHERKGEAGNKDSPDSGSEPAVGKWRSFKMGIRWKMRRCPKVPGRAKGFAKSSLDLEQGDWMEKIDEQCCKYIMKSLTVETLRRASPLMDLSSLG